ncbi:MAG: hypothetical protein KAW93_00620 [Methanogenium sp.]|nr:hypothetical protein [Methanogenium sp.]
MKRILIFSIMLLLICPIAGAVSPAESAAAQVSVTNVVIDPLVMMKGDCGTVTIEITNSGTEGVAIRSARLISGDITVVDNQNYATVGSIGGGNRMSFTFTVKANTPDGIYYPRFYIDYRDSGSLSYYIPLNVKDTELELSLTDKPDSFQKGKEEIVKILIGNPRQNAVNGVSLTPLGEGMEFTGTSYFIGNLAPDAAANVSFGVTPQMEGDIIFQVTYRNGINTHSTEISLPVIFSKGKKSAEPVLNNIEVITEGGHYKVTGDVTNAGLEDAKSVLVTSGSPGVPVDPFRVYVVGSLEPDDFSGFEITFTAEDADAIPLLISYKDNDGNVFEETVSVKLSGIPVVGTTDEGWSPVMIVILLLVVMAVVGIIAYSWKKR